MANDVVSLIPPGKLRCVVTGKLRKDTPEEHVRQRIARSLLEDYGYPDSTLELEFPVNLGSSKKRVDIAIFPEDAPHTQEHISIIVECKREEVKPTDRDNGTEQLKSYLAACLNSRFGIWIGSELQVWERVETAKGKHDFEVATDIPRFGADAPEPLTFAELVPAEEELVSIFKRCHNYIYGNQGLQKEPAFQELLKVIFCKVHDEDTSDGKMRFFISNEERRSDLGQRKLRVTMEQLFEEVQERYPYIFPKNEQLHLNNRVLAYVVGELQRFSLSQTRADVKGAAYEQLVGANLRGDRGEYFTPRNVCDMAARMAFATFPPEQRGKLRVLDPTCGTGGFLVAVLSVWRDHIFAQQLQKWSGDEGKAALETARLLKETARAHLVGIDFNPTLVRAAQMNLVMHGDGSTNVYQANSLLPPGEWSTEPPNDVGRNVKPNSFDLIVTNPPFGSKISIDDPHILEQFELARFEVDGGQRRASMPPEQLFVERCLYLLRPGGRLAIVLPDNILTNPGLSFIRRWLLKRARVLASIDLPSETFEPYTGTQTSVLLLQKKTVKEMEIEREAGRTRDYEVFMAMPRAVGHDRRGEVLHLRTPDGEVVEFEEETPVFRKAPDGTLVVERRHHRRKAVHDELPDVANFFAVWSNDRDRMRWLNG